MVLQLQTPFGVTAAGRRYRLVVLAGDGAAF